MWSATARRHWKPEFSAPNFKMATTSSSTTKSPQAVVKESLTGRPSLFRPGEYEGNKHNSARAEIRKQSQITPDVMVSLQHRHLKDNYSCLENAIGCSKNALHIQRLKGLEAILDVLHSETEENGALQPFMTFDEAFELFLRFQPGASISDRKTFKELFCHPEYGLCVYIVHNPVAG